MDWAGRIVSVFLVAAGVTAITLPLVRRKLTDVAIMDVPNERSSHVGAIPRGAGSAIALGVVVSAIAFLPPTRSVVVLLGTTAGFALIGLLDDIEDRAPLPRLIAQTLLAICASIAATGPITDSVFIGAVIAVLGAFWLVSFVNAFNFMDGINGISSVSAATAGAFYGVVGVHNNSALITFVAVALCASCLAFLPSNFPVARIFLGDVGSYFVGAVIASLTLFAYGLGAHPLALVAPLSIYLADTSVTLVRRALRGENLLLAHREHVYQRLSASQLGATSTLLLVCVLQVVCAACGIVIELGSGAGVVVAVLVLAVVPVGYVTGAELYLTAQQRRRERANGPTVDRPTVSL